MGLQQRSKFGLVLVGAILVLLFAPYSFAQSEDEDFPKSGARSAPDRAKLRMYAGGRDEQDLEVQSVLPHPSKTNDGPLVEPIPQSDSDRD